MRLVILLAGPALLLAACGTNGQADNTANADAGLSAENFSSNDVTAIDAVTGDSSNMAADVNYVSELNDSGGEGSDGDSPAPSAAKGATPRRSTGTGTDSNAAAPEPAANSVAATSNNAL